MRILATMLALAGVAAGHFMPRGVYRGATPPSRRGSRDKSKLPRNYPGAKIARAATQGRITLK